MFPVIITVSNDLLDGSDKKISLTCQDAELIAEICIKDIGIKLLHNATNYQAQPLLTCRLNN